MAADLAVAPSGAALETPGELVDTTPAVAGVVLPPEPEPAAPPPRGHGSGPVFGQDAEPVPSPVGAYENVSGGGPSIVQAPMVLGSRALRLVAQLIDGVVMLTPVLLISAAHSYAVAGVLYLLVALLYAPLLLARLGSANGQTIGKQLLGLRVVTLDHQQTPLTFGKAFLREFVGRSILNVLSFGLYSLVDSAWCLLDPRKQTLHDKIAGTVVATATSTAPSPGETNSPEQSRAHTSPGGAALPSSGVNKPLAVIVLAAIVIAAIIGIAISTSSSSSPVSASYPAAADVQTAETVSSTSTTAAPLPMDTNVTLNLSAPGGYTGTGTFELGAVQHASSGLQNGAITLGSACQVNNETDAVIPFMMSVTNTSPGFSASPGYSVSLAQPAGGNLSISAEVQYSEGPQCITFSEGNLGFSATDPMAPNASTTPSPGFFIVSNYYSPANPNGDHSSLSSASLQFTGSGRNEQYTVDSATGPGGSQSSGFTLPLVS